MYKPLLMRSSDSSQEPSLGPFSLYMSFLCPDACRHGHHSRGGAHAVILVL